MKRTLYLLALLLWAGATINGTQAACTDLSFTWLPTGGSDLGEMTTDNSSVWTYSSSYGAVGKKQGGATGWLLTPAKDLTDMQSVTLTFSHAHRYATSFTDEMTLYVTGNYTGNVQTTQWTQLTISPYASNTSWTYVDVTIDVPLTVVGSQTVFAFRYVSTASSYATWEIKNLTLNAVCGSGSGSGGSGGQDTTTVCEDLNRTFLATGLTDWGEMSQQGGQTGGYQWAYSSSYGAVVQAFVGPKGTCTDPQGCVEYREADLPFAAWLLTPAMDMRGKLKATVSFQHVHRYVGLPQQELTLWVTPDFTGSVQTSRWTQVPIPAYATNTNWTFVTAAVEVDTALMGARTVFAWKYEVLSTDFGQWEIKNLNIKAQCDTTGILRVRFLDWDGTLLKEETVQRGSDATPPAVPTREGYTFSHWDTDYTHVQDHLNITAIYTYDGTLATVPLALPGLQGFYDFIGDGLKGALVQTYGQTTSGSQTTHTLAYSTTAGYPSGFQRLQDVTPKVEGRTAEGLYTTDHFVFIDDLNGDGQPDFGGFSSSNAQRKEDVSMTRLFSYVSQPDGRQLPARRGRNVLQPLRPQPRRPLGLPPLQRQQVLHQLQSGRRLVCRRALEADDAG